ncbi:hypothetical protein QL285_045442 [Trifolium repens]|nr:hypothetical protein QL285_045442 [Trifolium repens]
MGTVSASAKFSFTGMGRKFPLCYHADGENTVGRLRSKVFLVMGTESTGVLSSPMNSSKKKPKHAGTPACFGNWKLLIPSFLRSWSNEQKKERKKQRISGNGFKKLQVNKGKGFIPKVFSICKCA